MQFVEYSEEYAARFREFLAQVAPGDDSGLELPFRYYLPTPGIAVRRHLVLGDTPDGTIVVGSIEIKVQDYSVAGEIQSVAVMKYPISLGVVDRKYAAVALFMFRKVAETYPLNYSLGMGRPDVSVVPRLVEKLGWTLNSIPYLFLPIRLGPLVQRSLAGRGFLESAARIASTLRLFELGDALLRLAMFARRRGGNDVEVRRVPDFDESLDGFWRQFSADVGFSLVRDCTQMNSIFPSRVPEFEKLVFLRAGELVGFAVLLVPGAEAAARFSGTRTITLVDANFLDRCVEHGVAALTRYLLGRDFDAVIVNTPHGKTIRALKRCGFIDRQTDMTLATSAKLQALLDARSVGLGDIVMSRADGDGPIGLGVDL